MAPSHRRQPPPPDRVADRLHSAAIHILRGLRQADRASGLSGPRLSALSVIVFGGPIRMTDLARAEQVRAPTMTLVVRGLMRAGLVELRKDPEDGRAKRVKATARGRALLQAALMEELSRPARTSAPRSGSRPPGRGR